MTNHRDEDGLKMVRGDNSNPTSNIGSKRALQISGRD
jgi:hypothetical protein